MNRELGWEECLRYKKITTVLVTIFVFTEAFCKMTKKGQKMSFHSRKVEIMTQRKIIETVIDFTE